MRTPEAVAGMLCPVCRVGLAMSDRQGIEIDYCPQCRGVWLDRGELDKIIERSVAAEAPAAPQPAPRPQPAPYPPQGGSPWGQQQRDPYRDDRDGHYQHGHDQRHGKPKRKKSLFEELFD